MKSKMVGLFAVVMIALMVAGVAYSAWTDSVAINVTATTGDVEFRILNFGVCSQSGGLNINWLPGVGAEHESIDVSIGNTYPGCWAFFCLQVKNTGTIPVKLYRMKITYQSGESEWMQYYYFAIPTGDQWCQIHEPVYYKNNLLWWSDWKYYGTDLNVPNPSHAASEVWVLGGYFELDTNAPQLESSTITVQLALDVIQALPQP